eukprot:PhF_6_TR32370/c1_g1_i1/m.48008
MIVEEFVHDVVWSGEGNTLVVRSLESNDVLWTWRPKNNITNDIVTALVFSPQHEDSVARVFVGYASGALRVFESNCWEGTAASSSDVLRHMVHKNIVNQILLSPRLGVAVQPTSFYTCSTDKHVKYWRLNAMEKEVEFLHCFEGSQDDVRRIGLCPSNPILVGVCSDFSIRLWNTHTHTLIGSVRCDVSRRTPIVDVERLLVHTLSILMDSMDDGAISLERHFVAASYRSVTHKRITATIGDTIHPNGQPNTKALSGASPTEAAVVFYESVATSSPPMTNESLCLSASNVSTPLDGSICPVPPPVRCLSPTPDRTVSISAEEFMSTQKLHNKLFKRTQRRLLQLVKSLQYFTENQLRGRYFVLWKCYMNAKVRSFLEVNLPKPCDPLNLTVFADLNLVLGGTFLSLVPSGVAVIVWVSPQDMVPTTLESLRIADVQKRISQCVVRDRHAYEHAPSVQFTSALPRKTIFLEVTATLAVKADPTRAVVINVMDVDVLWAALQELWTSLVNCDDVAVTLQELRCISSRRELHPPLGWVEIMYLE